MIERTAVNVSAVTTYPGTAQVIFPAEPNTITITVDDPAGKDVAVSFDGVNTHAVLEAGAASAGVRFTGVVGMSMKVWLKEGSSGNGASMVQVIGSRE